MAERRRLLARAAELLTPGGRLVSPPVRCRPEEGEAQLAALLARARPAAVDPVGRRRCRAWPRPSPRPARAHAARFWAERGGMDGFFVARFRKA